MNRLKVDVLVISETFWKGSGESMYELPSGERFKVVYSGGEKHRKGVKIKDIQDRFTAE